MLRVWPRWPSNHASSPHAGHASKGPKGGISSLLRQRPEGNCSWRSRESRSVTGMRLVRRCVDGGQLGAGAFIGFQTLDEGLRPFFILCEGKKRITLATVDHRPGLLSAFFETRAATGIRRRRRARRRERSSLLYCPGLYDVPQQGHDTLELIIQAGQACWIIAWALASFP
jgi:hypothetical protein